MKILNINKFYYPVIGGMETVASDISEGLNGKENITIDVLTCQVKGKRSIEEINGVKVHKAHSFGRILGMPISFDFFIIFFKLKNDYDLILINHPFPLASIAVSLFKINKLIIFYHSDIVRQKITKIFIAPFISKSLKKAQTIITTGKNIIENSKCLKKFKNKCLVVPLGIKDNMTVDYQKKINKIKEECGDKTIILSVGRLVYYKGFIYLIRAMKNINGTLIIIGEGPDKKKLDNEINNFGVSEKVKILPFQNRLEPYFEACDIFVLPSCEKSEAFGIVQLEAMRAGKPTINTKLGTAVEEVSVDHMTGITVEPKDSRAIELAINDLIKNKEKMSKFGINAKKRYEQNYRIEIFLKKIKGVIFHKNIV